MDVSLDGYFHHWNRDTDEVIPLTLDQFRNRHVLFPFNPVNSYDEPMRVAVFKVDDITVSTIFLGQNVSIDNSNPVFFETMVLGGPLDEEQMRYRTAAEARSGHAEMVERVLASLPPSTRSTHSGR
jgi:hypothetical protein